MKKPPALRVPELLDHAVEGLDRALEEPRLTGRVVEREQPLGEAGVVFEQRLDRRDAVESHPPQAAGARAAPTTTTGRRRARRRRASGRRPARRKPSASAVIIMPFHAVSTLSSRSGGLRCARATTQPLAHAVESLERGGERHARFARHGVERLRQVEDGAAVLEVPFGGDPEDLRRPRRIAGAERPLEVRRRPDEEAALGAVAVGIGRGVEAAVGRRHLAQHVVERLLGGPAEREPSGESVTRQVGARELRLVVEHLLEVRNLPRGVGRVAMEAAADLIEDPAARHGVERALGDARGIGARAARRLVEQEQQLRLRRELGRSAEAAVDRVFQPDQIRGRARGRVGADRHRLGARRRHLAHGVGEAGRGDLELGAVAAPTLRYGAQQLGELIARQVGGAEERTARRA